MGKIYNKVTISGIEEIKESFMLESVEHLINDLYNSGISELHSLALADSYSYSECNLLLITLNIADLICFTEEEKYNVDYGYCLVRIHQTPYKFIE